MIESENHQAIYHGSGKNYQWMLKLLWKVVGQQDIHISSNLSTHSLPINCKEKKQVPNLKKPGNHHLNQMIKFHIAKNNTNSYGAPDVMPREGHTTTSILAKKI